jgi:hypothetical protein
LTVCDWEASRRCIAASGRWRERRSPFPWPGSAAGPFERDHSEATARDIDVAARAFLDDAFAAATAILERRRSELEEGARLLLEKETLTAEDFPALKNKSERKAGSAAEAQTSDRAGRASQASAA